MQKSSNRVYKLLVVGVIVLFIGIVIQPVFAANVNDSISDETVEITVSRYKADGSVEKTKVILSKEKALEFAKRYRNIDDSDKRFSLLKEYGLISEDVTGDQLRQEMLNLADELGVTEEKIKSISERFANKRNNNQLLGINFLNRVAGAALFSFNLPIGLSLITGIYNWWERTSPYAFDLPSVDLLYVFLFYIGNYFFYDGILPDYTCEGGVGFISLLGFIGFIGCIPFVSILTFTYGYTVASLFISRLIYPG